MTSLRRQRKLRRGGFGPLLAIVALCGIGGTLPFQGATTEQVVVDHHSGLANSGFDPVAYFTEGVASEGKGDFEYRFAGAIWRFRNQGNRTAFKMDPEVYMPRFGGHDPIGIARGVAVPGHPKLWFVAGERLYLFTTVEAQAAFVLDADRAIAAADRKWPAVRLLLSP